MNFLWALAVISAVSSVKCDSVTPCNISDQECLKKSSTVIYSKFIDGDSKIGTENLEPMYHDVIEGNLSILKYKFTNTTIEGFIRIPSLITVTPCNISDQECLKKSSTVIYSKFIDGDSKIGTENLEPMYHDVIEGNLSILKYKFTNTTIEGFKDCKAEHVKFDIEALTLKIELICKAFTIRGKYEISGRLIILPVEGNGDYTIATGKYRVNIDSEIKVSPGKDGKNYMSVKNFKQKSEALANVKFDFKNLFNGREDLAEVVLKFANENWLDVTNEFQHPVFDASVKKIMKNGNKFLKTLPLEGIISS